nr:glucan endo-1,3-beta-glucosidase 8-like [Ipomoea batatas]
MERRWSWVAVLLLLLGAYGVDGFIGIHWGRFATQSLVPSMVVDLLLQNGIKEIKLSSPSPNVLEALQSSSLGVTVALQNDFIRRPKWTSNVKNISSWVKDLLLEPVQRGVPIKSGSEGFIGMQWGRFATQSLVPSMVVDMLLQNGIREIRLSSPSPNVMMALQRSELGVTVALQNDFIKRPKWLSNIKNVSSWVEELLVPPVQRGVHIKYVSLILPYLIQFHSWMK